MPFNYTWEVIPYINISSTQQMLTYANTVTGDVFMTGFTFMIWIVTFMITNRFSDKDAFAVSSFVAAMFAFLFRMAGLIGDWLVLLFIIVTGVAVALQMR